MIVQYSESLCSSMGQQISLSIGQGKQTSPYRSAAGPWYCEMHAPSS